MSHSLIAERFRLLSRLAVGGMGEVFLAEDTQGETTPEIPNGALPLADKPSHYVALKRILPHLTQERELIDRFVDEARLMTQLRHSCLLPVYELRHDQWGLYMVMEYLDGYDVRAISKALERRAETWPATLAVWVALQVAEGLSYAHAQNDESGASLGLVHRDVSPSNILINTEGEVKLIDFGIARAQGGLHQSVSGALQGKFVYMSPEQANGEELSAQSDLFSLGITLYEMLSGERPRSGLTDAELLKSAQSDEVTSLELDWPEGDPALIAIVDRVVNRDPSARHSDATELAQSLRTWLEHNGGDMALREERSDDLSKWLRALPLTTPLMSLNVSASQDRVHGHLYATSYETQSELGLNQALELQILQASPELSSDRPLTITHSASADEGAGDEGGTSQITITSTPLPKESRALPLTPGVSGLLISTREQQSFQETLDGLMSREISGEIPAEVRAESSVVSRKDATTDSRSSESEAPPSGFASRARSKLRPLIIWVMLCLSIGLLYSLSLINQSQRVTVHLKQRDIRSNETSPLPTELKNAVTIDGERWSASRRWVIGQPLEVCFTHTQWVSECHWVTLERDRGSPQEVTITLKRRGLMTITELPTELSTQYSTRASRGGVSDSTKLSKTSNVPERVPDSAHELSPVSLRATEVTPDQAQSTRAKNLPRPTKRQPKRPTKHLTRQSRFKGEAVSLTTQLSQVKLSCREIISSSPQPQGEPRGMKAREYILTPQTRLGLPANTRCRASSKGYATRELVIPNSSRLAVVLEPVGTLSIRIFPPASRVWLNGEEIKNPSDRLILKGEKHEVKIKYRSMEGVELTQLRALSIKPGERVKVYLDLTQESLK